MKAPSNHATLLPVDQRTCEIPRQVKGGMGQSNIWYADNPISAPLVERVVALLGGKPPKGSKQGGRSKKQDQERKALVEKAAIRTCCKHFDNLGYTVESVEKDDRGWDLEAKSGKTTLCIEVKGLSGSAFSIELTPNEFQAFAQKSDAYRLAVVRTALDTPQLSICRYSRAQAAWVIEGDPGGTLQIETRQSASIKCI